MHAGQPRPGKWVPYPSTRLKRKATARVLVGRQTIGFFRNPMLTARYYAPPARTGARWSEGPVYFGDARCLYWSDIPNNRILRWDEVTGDASVYRQPSNNANGNTRDRQGRLVTCEHDTRRVTRTEYDGTITTLIDRFNGNSLNAP